MATSIQSASSRTNVLEIVGNAIVGGMETSVARLLDRLPAQQFGVSVLCPFESSFTDKLRATGAEVYITPMPHEDPLWSSIQLAVAMVKSGAIDLVHTHLPNAHLLGGIVGRLTDKPVLATIHGRQIGVLDFEVHRAAATHLHAVCRQTYFQALGIGVSANQLHFVPNGVDTEVFTAQRNRHGRLRRLFGISEEAVVAGFVGRLSPEKGPDVFLRAALAIRETCPTAHFVMLGEGPMESQLQAFVAQFGLASTVHFAGVCTDMPSAMAELDLLLLTSRSEAMPLALMEAMASGLPVVATSVGGVPDLVQHGVSGWLTAEGDYEDIAVRAVALIGDMHLRDQVGRHARERAIARLSLSDTVASMSGLLKRLAQGRSPPRRISSVSSEASPAGALASAPGAKESTG